MDPLTNTPFDGLIMDVAIIIITHCHVEDLFKMMRLSWNCYRLLDDEIHWKHRVLSLFSPSRIEHYTSILPKSDSRHRIAAMLNYEYPDKLVYNFFNRQFRNSPSYRVWKEKVSPSVYAVIRNTFGRYVRYMSFRPLNEFKSHLLKVLPGEFQGERIIMCMRYSSFHVFDKSSSRHGLLCGFIRLVVDMFDRQSPEIIDDKYIMYCIDVFKTHIDDPTNELVRFLEPYIEVPTNAFICDECTHSVCERRRLAIESNQSLFDDVMADMQEYRAAVNHQARAIVD